MTSWKCAGLVFHTPWEYLSHYQNPPTATYIGDVHLTVFCVEPRLFHFSMFTVSAWKNAMAAMVKRRETCYGSHGKKATMAK